MLREVSLRFSTYEKSYSIESDTHYGARVIALGKFLEEFKIPGKPVEFLTKKKGLIEITVRSEMDGRTADRSEPSTEFYLGKVESLRKQIRESSLPEEKKVVATKHLLALSSLLGNS